MKLTELFDKGEFVISSEVGPVKGCVRDTGNGQEPVCMKEARELKGKIHALNVTDNQSAVMRLGSLAASIKLKAEGMEPIFQMTCRDRNRIALQSDLLNACSLGIDNVLCLTGDHIALGDHKQAKPVFDIDSVGLLKIAKTMNEGKDMVGNDLTQPTDLALGAVVNPNADPLDLQIFKMESKISAGAQFFQTQAIYDPAVFEKFVKRVEGFKVPIQVGFVMLKSPAMAKFMNNNVSGITVPESLIEEMASVPKGGRKEKSVEITVRLLKEMAPMVQGIHFMPLGWSNLVPSVIEQLDLKH